MEKNSGNANYVLSENNLNEHQMQYKNRDQRNKNLSKTGDQRNSLNLMKNFQEHINSHDTLVTNESKRYLRQDQSSGERMKRAYKPRQKLIN